MKKLDWQTLRDDGYLQEVNREFFHPHGLALAVELSDKDGDGNRTFLGLYVIDARDDPEGFNFADGDDLTEKASRLRRIADARREARMKGLGYWQQPCSVSDRGAE